jgi:ribosomal protein S18 acetylase RimI-like enzyme
MREMTTKTDPADILIESARISDAEALSALGRKTFTEKFGQLYSAENLNMFLEDSHSVSVYHSVLGDPAYRVWKAVAPDGHLVGYAVAGRCKLDVGPIPDNAMEIKRLYVDESAQSLGLGRRLMEAMLDWIDADGRKPVYLSVYAHNDGAQRFYSRYGFSWFMDTTFLVGDHVDPEMIFARLT